MVGVGGLEWNVWVELGQNVVVVHIAKLSPDMQNCKECAFIKSAKSKISYDAEICENHSMKFVGAHLFSNRIETTHRYAPLSPYPNTFCCILISMIVSTTSSYTMYNAHSFSGAKLLMHIQCDNSLVCTSIEAVHRTLLVSITVWPKKIWFRESRHQPSSLLRILNPGYSAYGY